MAYNNVLVTGTPRSGTTLTCHLLNSLPDTVALHEPMRVGQLAVLDGRAAISRAIAQFCDDQRRSIHEQKRAISKHVDGAVPDNPVGPDRTASGLRRSIVEKSTIVVDRPLSPEFMLVIKHNAAFTALLEELTRRFTVYAVVRNPIATLASWSSVNFSVRRGHAPAAEKLDPALAATLRGIDDDLDRQIALLGWFHDQFRTYLPAKAIIRYEEVVASGGRALRVIRPEAETLSVPMESRNTSSLYDHFSMQRIGERLLASDGAHWEWYGKESVRAILDELPVSVQPVPPAPING